MVWGKPKKFGLVEPTKQDAIGLQLDGIIHWGVLKTWGACGGFWIGDPYTFRGVSLRRVFLCTWVVGSKLTQPLIQRKNHNYHIFIQTEEYHSVEVSASYPILSVKKFVSYYLFIARAVFLTTEFAHTYANYLVPYIFGAGLLDQWAITHSLKDCCF